MKRLDPLALPLSGTELVEASAGTGKTHTITTLFLRCVLERRLGVDRILVVTFTKAATAELRDRLRRRLRDTVEALERGSGEGELGELVRARRPGDLEWARQALGAFDQAAVFTIHGFCQRALVEFAFESGVRFELELVADQRALIRELCADFWARELGDASPALLVHLEREGSTLERWKRIASLALAWPDLELSPAPRGLDPGAPLERYVRARESARRALAEGHVAVERLLTDKRVMNQRSYAADKVGHWLLELDALLGRSDATLGGWFDEVEKLRPRALDSGVKKGARPPEHPFFNAIDDLCTAHAAALEALDDRRVELEHALVTRVQSEIRDKKLALGVQSFDDLLLQLSRALNAKDGGLLAARLAERYPVALVDEFQDTDPVQYGIFRRIWGERGTLLLIGDPKQAIYGFRGADIFSYLEAARDAGDRVYTLGTNHRSDPSLIAAVNTLYSRADAPFVLDGIEFTAVDPAAGARDLLARRSAPLPPFEVALFDGGDQGRVNKTTHELAPRVAAHIARDLGAGISVDGQPLRPEHIAVLTRTNVQAIELSSELAKLGVDAVLLGDKSVLDTDEATELAFVLRALAAPSDERAVIAALSTAPFGRSGQELAALREDAAAWEREIEAFRGWHSAWEHFGFVHAFRAMLREADVPARLLGSSGGERRLTNFQHLAELLHRAAIGQHLGIAGLRRWFDEVRFDLDKRGDLAPDAQQIRLESDARALKLTTMHKSKGLEYPVVYCPYLWDGTLRTKADKLAVFHDPSRGHRPRLALDAVPKESDEAEYLARERQAENMRLAYVALTRAKHRVSVVWGPFRTNETSPLATLLHAPAPETGERNAAARVHVLDAKGLAADVERLARRDPGLFELAALAEEAEPRARPARPGAESLTARPLTRRLDVAWRSSSFSALVAGGRVELGAPVELGRDVDAGTAASPHGFDEPSADDRVPLHAFPRGAKAGDALHELFERLDFQSTDPALVAATTRRVLDRHGIDATHAPALAGAVADILATPLSADGMRLADVPAGARAAELEFTFPVSGQPTRLSARALSRAFAADPRGLPARYAADLAALEFSPLEGFLRGFIDLVFEHAGRVYVVDYKSNYLGARARDYVPARLAESMTEHHYFLQYHLYTLAVVRHFTLRRPGFDYERDFGGVLYLFLRGMSPARGPSTGVFFERPPPARIAALSELVAEGARR